MTEPADRPGVIALPPLVYLAAIVVAIGLDWLAPLTLPVATAVRWLGGVVILASFGFGISAPRAFRRAGTNVNPMEPSTALVTSGVFQITRNPMYVTFALAIVGLALATRNAWYLIVLVPVLALMHWGVILREERYLARKFGTEYEAYRSKVRRYF
jgi:protein-S-isoprenylcysteine O-methyltransferase Ste14